MKKAILPYGYTLSFILIGSLLVSLLLAVLFFFQWVGTALYQGILWVLGIALFLGAGFCFGRFLSSRILIQILVLSLVILVVCLLFAEHSWIGIVRVIIKCLAYFLGALLGQKLRLRSR